MKKALIIIILISISQLKFLNAQVNLVPNPSFETITTCNLGAGGINSGEVPPWDSPSDGSPDPYNTCNIGSISGWVPNNWWGYQNPHSGNGYAGEVFFATSSGQDVREYLQIQLDSTLIAGKKYCSSFYINCVNVTNVVCNNFGMYFSNAHHYVQSLSPLNFTPQINDTSIVSDTVGWTLVSGDFIANGGEKYLIIGNFYSNLLTDTATVNGLYHQSYYFIDDVSVIDCTNQGVVSAGSTAEEIEVFPNPASNILTVKIKNNTRQKSVLEIKDMLGQNLYIELLQTPVINIDVSHYPSGIYFINIKNATQSINKKFIKE